MNLFFEPDKVRINKLKLLLRSLLLLLLLSACGSRPPAPIPTATPRPDVLLVNYFSQSGRFEVWLPTIQSIHEDRVTQTELGQSVECSRLWSRDNGALWMIQYCDYPQDVISPFTTKELLDHARDQVLQAEHARLIAEQEIILKDLYPGRFVIAEAGMKGAGQFYRTYKARIYVAGSRLYSIMAVVYEENWGNRMSLIDPFLESFSIESS